MATQTDDGRGVTHLTLINEFTRESLAIRVARRIKTFGVIETLADTMRVHGIPEHKQLKAESFQSIAETASLYRCARLSRTHEDATRRQSSPVCADDRDAAKRNAYAQKGEAGRKRPAFRSNFLS